jgi:hypothetical protein
MDTLTEEAMSKTISTDDLAAQLKAAQDRRNELARQREIASFEAIRGELGAKQRLAALKADLGNVAEEIETLEHALKGAAAHAKAAEHKSAAATERAKATRILIVAGEQRRLAVELDRAAAKLGALAVAYLEAAGEISRSGIPGAPNFRATQLAAGRAISAQLYPSLGKALGLQLLSPSLRRPVAEAAGRASESAEAWARGVLGDSGKKKAA